MLAIAAAALLAAAPPAAAPALAAGGRISGTVTDASTGAPLPSIAVYVFDSSGSLADARFTSTSGVYETTGVPPGTYYAMTGYSRLYIDELFDGIPCPSWSCTVNAGTPIVVAEGATTTGINFTLAPGGRISGTVTDATSGAPLVSVTVYLYGPDGANVGSADTSASGTYATSGLPAGTYYARTWNALGYLDELFDDVPCAGTCTVTAGAPIVVTRGTTTTGINFALTAGGRIGGTVTDASSGAALASIAVYVFDSSGASVDAELTNASGAYQTAGLPPGTYYAMTGYSSPYIDELFDGIPCPSWTCTVTAGTPIVVTRGDTTGGTDFALDRPLSFFTVTPCRVVDTRDATRGGPLPLAAGSDTALALTGGECGIPPGARAVSINITVTLADDGGHLRLHPAGSSPPQTSTLNYVAGQTRATNAVVPVNGSGELGVYVAQPSGSVHVIVDVNGFFE